VFKIAENKSYTTAKKKGAGVGWQGIGWGGTDKKGLEEQYREQLRIYFFITWTRSRAEGEGSKHSRQIFRGREKKKGKTH